jgi:hypothetical protein
MMATRHFPPPWSIDEKPGFFVVTDSADQVLAHIIFEDETQRQMPMKRLLRDEAFPIAVNIAKLPRVPQQILKDIPWPPHKASEE